MSDDQKKEEPEYFKNFDMYHFLSRKDVMFVVVFLIAFLIFSLAVFFAPQVI